MANTPRKLWFKAKRYGWGWRPVSVEGWFITILYIIVLVKIFGRVDATSHSASDTLITFFLPFVITTGVLIWVCYLTGEKPRWRWGNK